MDATPAALPSATREFDDLSEDVARALLARALGAPGSPAAELIAALSSPRADASLRDRLLAGVATRCPRAEERLAMGGAPLEELIARKDAAKEEIARAPDATARMAATLLYLLAIAAALVHRNTCITSQEKAQLARTCARLAGLVPSPWRTLLGCAAETLAGT